jgi:DNA-binding NtrC family response regulator
LSRRILVVCRDGALRMTRAELLSHAGYTVVSVATDDDAMARLMNEQFDLVLLGCDSAPSKVGLDQRIREKYPDLLTLKIVNLDVDTSVYASRLVDAEPGHVIAALRNMLGDGLTSLPPNLPAGLSQTSSRR